MDVKLPNLGEGADSGTVVNVLVKAGASVKKGQNLIELETGKAVAPIPSPASGTIARLAVKEGDKVGVGQLIAVIEGVEGGAAAEPAAAPKESGKAAGSARAKEPARPEKRRSAAPKASVREEVEEATGDSEDAIAEETVVNEDPVAGPYVRRVARDLGLDLRYVAGSGRSGQVVIADLRDYISQLRARAARPTARGSGVAASPAPVAAPSVDFSQWGPVSRTPMSVMRKTIAARMVESATRLPTVTQFDEADVTVLNDLRKKHGAAYEARGARLTLTSFVFSALARTLRKHPMLNASLDEAAGEIVLKDYVHVGMAVDTEAGLLVPVLRDVDRKDLLGLSKEIQELAVKARERKLGLAEMQGGSFTLSNQGGIGGAHFTPIINVPESAILGVGRSVLRPVVHEGAVVPRLMMPLALTYDHRLIDGGGAARFMVDLVAALQAFREEDVRL